MTKSYYHPRSCHGKQGPRGATGPQGPSGAITVGPSGVQGEPGPVGFSLIGATGPTGPGGNAVTGAQGPPGNAGLAISGATGPTGASGAGLLGTTGASGNPGVGISGPSGVTGPSGASLLGPSGATGPTRLSGYGYARRVTSLSDVNPITNIPMTNVIPGTPNVSWEVGDQVFRCEPGVYLINFGALTTTSSIVLQLFNFTIMNPVANTQIQLAPGLLTSTQVQVSFAVQTRISLRAIPVGPNNADLVSTNNSTCIYLTVVQVA